MVLTHQVEVRRVSDEKNLSKKTSKPVPIRYVRPSALKSRRGLTMLVRSDIMVAAVQVFTEGAGERNLHSHDERDGFWFVLSGKARFYDLDNCVIAEPSGHEGVFIPRNVPYWFESIGSEPLEILQIQAIDKSVPSRVKFYGAQEKISFENFTTDGSPAGQVDIDPATHAGAQVLDDLARQSAPGSHIPIAARDDA
jgi:mannose-6-phosphate isomerase-like protein (cupin superfamily)